ncbi:hypothetical protein ABT404_03190 [Streptomyces hyaluromycini]|uniref:Uncharacterized protein n=1 Tax=Streptomyces hyaluromycini TaxID=1377993 RepID=A0ABV1WQB3_9ACTN
MSAVGVLLALALKEVPLRGKPAEAVRPAVPESKSAGDPSLDEVTG